MIYKDGENAKIEELKSKFSTPLKGDVYMVENHIESLETHKIFYPESTATTIEEAEAERIALLTAEKEARAQTSAATEEELNGTDEAIN